MIASLNQVGYFMFVNFSFKKTKLPKEYLLTANWILGVDNPNFSLYGQNPILKTFYINQYSTYTHDDNQSFLFYHSVYSKRKIKYQFELSVECEGANVLLDSIYKGNQLNLYIMNVDSTGLIFKRKFLQNCCLVNYKEEINRCDSSSLRSNISLTVIADN